ncbi:MAG: nitrous oxide reductase family maturation protein NosD [Planctomycetes bacterium]|nr:nitrous oxide reductase family maturation protein NosD [Planctomycetota bacterium]
MNRVIGAILVCGGAWLARAGDTPASLDHEAPARTFASRQSTLAGALSARIAAAQAGAVIEIGAGVYHEHLRIDKPLTLIGRPGAIIDGAGSGDIVEIAAEGVTFRGFTVRNTGIDLEQENAAIRVLAGRATIEDNVLEDVLFGIDLRSAPDCVVRGNRIGGKALDIARRGDGLRLWRSDRGVIENNVLHDGRDAILWYSSGIKVRGNRSDDCRYGLHLMFSDDVVIEDNTLSGNSVGIYLMYSAGVEITRNRLVRNRGPSGYGIGLKEADRFSVRENLITGNRVGVYLDGSPFTTKQPGVFTRNIFAFNDIGVTFLPSARGNEFTDNNFIDNIDQVAVSGRGALTGNRFWKGERGNFWSDYTGYDRDADGIGDFVHESRTLFESMTERNPEMRLFLFSPAQQAIEFVGRAVPAVRPEAKFEDEVPRMRPVEIGFAKAESGVRSMTLAATAFGLLAIGGGVLRAARKDGGP